ncbi:hypothetical protein HN51_044621 [Arachis hypogaea]
MGYSCRKEEASSAETSCICGKGSQGLNWASTFLVSKFKGLAERKKLEDLTIGPVLTLYITILVRTYKIGGCDLSSTAPPCTRWIEMMAPIFSRAAWHCVWYMIQVD